MLFWIICAALALTVAALIGLAGLRASAQGGDGGADMQVYRAQLREVEADHARGGIGPDEAARLRNEIARRLLAADAGAARAARPLSRLSPAAAGGIGLFVGAAALGLYGWMGAPGYGDLALKDRIAQAEAYRTTRPSQAEAEAEAPPAPRAEASADFAALMQQLRQAVETRPDDLQGLRLLARNEAILGNLQAANAAQSRILSVLGDGAQAQDYLDRAEYLIIAAGGYVSPEAEAALRGALARDEGNGGARYYTGLMWSQTGRPDVAFRIWDRLLRDGPEDAPWIAPIRAQIDAAAMRAGVDYTQPPAAPPLNGPSAADVAAAQDMSAEDRQEMIRGMVTGLSERLASQGGSAAEWARLIAAYGVLGETARARAIRDEALEVFRASPEDLAQIQQAGQSAGLTE